MKLVLDTSIFNSEKFINWLLLSKEEKYLPAIVYMEYLHHHLKQGNTESMVDAFLDQMNITVVPFGKNEAIKAAKENYENSENQNSREYEIASTALILKAKLVTNNLKAFKWLENAVKPDDILKNDE
ncbi:type II toxin-antitoxin system VapC family toxin [Methanobacterium oryzae]|uniref:type II toxin-antitoxin system VapC family toxin n=1 Tax=Methanobacterium oryzae TaxID=69540 RepID=UPI003D1B8698